MKPHPQHNAEMLEGIHRRIDGVPRVTLLPGDADTRELIVSSNVVVGFQTTALAEAMAAGKRVVYTFWTDAVQRVKGLLLPYHELDGCIEVAVSAEDLGRRLRDVEPRLPTKAQERDRMAFVEAYLGPIDGQASKRVWRVLEERAAAAAPPPEAARALRGRLRADAGAYCHREARRAGRRLQVRSVAALVARLVAGPKAAVTRRLAQRRDAERDRVLECREAVSGPPRALSRLVGHDDETLLGACARFAGHRLFGARR